MQNFVQVGEQLTIAAPSDVSSGQGLVVGAMFGVCTHSAKTGQDLTLRIKGVVRLPKASGAITALQKVYWDAANARVTTTASGNRVVGVAQAAVTAATTAEVVLDGVAV